MPVAGVEQPLRYTEFPLAGKTVDQETAAAFDALCLACRKGDIEEVEALLSTPNLDINMVDEWDYSPLILLLLCGHLPVVELLLKRGAVCDRDTYQGARCIYGALTDSIRDLLISFDVSKAVDTAQPFASHISSLTGPLALASADICFHFPHVNGPLVRDYQSVCLHRFLLATRSKYFMEKLRGEWSKQAVITMPTSVKPEAFKAVVDYLYLKPNSLSAGDDVRQYADSLDLDEAVAALDALAKVRDVREAARLKNEHTLAFPTTAREHFRNYLREEIFYKRIEVALDVDDLVGDDGEVDASDIKLSDHITSDQVQQLIDQTFCDIIVGVVDAEREVAVYYPAHKLMLARAEYFETMFKSPLFLENNQVPHIVDSGRTLNRAVIDRPNLKSVPVLQLLANCADTDVAEMILEFLYHDDVPSLPLDKAIDLLFCADELLLARLKLICAVKITVEFPNFTWKEFKSLKAATGYDGYDLLRIAWQLKQEKLEQHITRMLAFNLQQVFENDREKMLTIIAESAERIAERQTTDTIEVIDDIRYYLGKKYIDKEAFADIEGVGLLSGAKIEETDIMKQALLQYDQNMEIIELLLDSLDLEA
ncbi:BTB/POZ domain-containing protein [Kocuria palustris]|nr:BTB/POZ domain-containing protein [Kocuria palustris]